MKIDYILSFILLLFSIITLSSCIYAIKQFRQNSNKSIAWLIVFSFIVFVYCFSYSMELACTTVITSYSIHYTKLYEQYNTL